MSRQRLFAHVVVMALALSCMGASCGEVVVRLMPGVVNNPGNRSLRRAIFNFASDQVCSELLERSLPLKLRDSDPAIGRYFPTSCNVRELDGEDLLVSFAGHGYAWSNVTGRVGFEASATVQYDHDFIVSGSSMYIYFRQKKATATKFQPLVVERAKNRTPAGTLLGPDVKSTIKGLGESLLRHQLARGFTVVRGDDGEVSFALGVLEKGKAVDAPFGRGDSDWKVLANERTEVHKGQRDYVGPFTIRGRREALHITVAVEGAAAVDLIAVTKPVGDSWLRAYETQPVAGPAPPNPPPYINESVPRAVRTPGQPAQVWRRKLVAPPGRYYLVFDNTATAGRTTPEGALFDDRAALVSYAVQLGEP